MNFSQALTGIKRGLCAAREGWNGKGMFIYLVPGSRFAVNRPPLNELYEEGTEVSYVGHIDMRTADGSHVPWVASHTDLLYDDWVLIEVDEYKAKGITG